MKLGILANEFFSQDLGPLGGFGWAARQVALTFNRRSSLGVTVVFLAARLKSSDGASCTRVHDTTLLFRASGRKYRHNLIHQNLDLILTIDYRPSYWTILDTLSTTPVIVWVRDPRPAATQAKIATLKLPESGLQRPQGIKAIDCTSLSKLMYSSDRARRPLMFGTPAPTLTPFIEGVYGINQAHCIFLPNIVDMRAGRVRKSESPRVIFLGRLDPIKRPWLFVELARAFPQVEFLMLGKSHFEGLGTWSKGTMPSNLKILGHLEGDHKCELLSSAWVLVNTSIHESLATSFLEALACETPLLSCNNPEGIVLRFGLFTGSYDGDGIDSLPAFVSGLAYLLENGEQRGRLGKAGRQWVECTHNASNFLSAFDKLCKRAGLRHRATN